MCGLVGVAGNLTAKHVDCFKNLLVLDTLRGPQSTGVAGVGVNGDWDLVKKKGNAWDLFDSKEYAKAASQAKYILIGHNRYATKGKINNINAHPFEFANVVGTHNGTIRGQHRLVDHNDFEVDSENIFHSIEQVGLEDTLAVLDGAYALVYWDKRTEELVMVRNSERPLYYAYSKDNTSLYWASEEWMLHVAVSRAGLDKNDVVEVKPCTIHRFEIDMKFNPAPIKCSIQGFKEFKPPVVHRQPALPPGNGPAKGKSTPLGKAAASSEELRKLQGTVIEFEVAGHKQNAHNQWYVSGEVKGMPGVEVRIHAAPNSPEWNLLTVQYDSVFEGQVTSFAQYGEVCYVMVKVGSVEEVIDEEDDSDWGVFLGFNNKLLDEDDWYKLTRKGCAWCGEIPDKDDNINLEWLADDKHVCAGCQESPQWEELREEA